MTAANIVSAVFAGSWSWADHGGAAALKNRTGHAGNPGAPAQPLTAVFLLLTYLAFSLAAEAVSSVTVCWCCVDFYAGRLRGGEMPGAGPAQKTFRARLLLFTVVADIWFMTVICRLSATASRTARCRAERAKDGSRVPAVESARPGRIEVDDRIIPRPCPRRKYNIYRHARMSAATSMRARWSCGRP